MKTAQQLSRGACVFALVMSGAVSSLAMAQDEEGFSGRAGLGFLGTSGNTENESLNANFDLWWNYEPWSHSLRGLAIRADTSGVTTAEAFSLDWQSRYEINEKSYVFGLISYDDDEFSAIETQTREVIGYGRRIIENDRQLWNAQVGAGARQADLRSGLSEDESIIFLGTDYLLNISDTSTFTQTLTIEDGSSNRYTEATSALSTEIRENLAIVLSYTIKNNSDVAPGLEKTDTFTAISIEYGF